MEHEIYILYINGIQLSRICKVYNLTNDVALGIVKKVKRQQIREHKNGVKHTYEKLFTTS